MGFGYMPEQMTNHALEVSNDLRKFISEHGEAQFDPKSIEIARTLISDVHIDAEDGMRGLSGISRVDPNEIQDLSIPKPEYDVEGRIQVDINIETGQAITPSKSAFRKNRPRKTRRERMADSLKEMFPPPARAPIQTMSTNKSAVNMAKLLFNLDVKRWYLPLLLEDASLDGIDPYDENLTEDQKYAIAEECTRNIFYYCREVVRIPAPGATKGVQMRMHIGAFTAIYLSANDVTYYLEQPRQTYKSGTDNAIVGWVWNFAARNSQMALYANNVTKAKDNLINVIDILENLPSYLQFFKYQMKESKDGISMISDCQDYAKGVEIHHKLFGNKIYAGTTGQTKENAMKTARGKSVIILRFDEIGFSKYNWLAYGSAQPSHEEAAAVADRHGIPHNIAMTSTPPDATTKEGEWLHKLLFEECVPFSLKLFDLSKEEIKQYMKANGKKDIVFCSFAYNELGFTQEWLVDRLRKLDRDVFDVEVMLKWKRILNRSPFSRRALELIEIYAKNSWSDEIILNNKDRFIIYEDFEKCRYKRILVGIDIAGGGGNASDYSTMVGVDPLTTKILFTYRTNESDTEIFARTIVEFCRQYVPNAVLIVERNGIGRGVVDKLKYCDDISDNLYYQSETINDGFYINSKDTGVRKDKYGLDMTHTVREIMHKEILNTRVNRYKTYFNSIDIVRELMSITVTASGRYDHLPGYHDDLLMAYLMTLYVLYKDMDLDAKFGITVPAILDDEAKAYNTSDAFIKKENPYKNLNEDQIIMERIKASAISGNGLYGYKTLEDDTYRRDVETAKYESQQLSTTDDDDNPDKEITVSRDGRLPTFGNRGGVVGRSNSLMPSAFKKFNF